MSDIKLQLTDSEKVDVADMEHLFSEIHFQRLLDLATEVCLTDPLPNVSVDRKNQSFNQKLINNTGALALRAALEMNLGYEINTPPETENIEEDEKGILVTFDGILRDPGRFYDIANPIIIAKAERFGKAIIDESFKVLGKDTIEHVEKMRDGNEFEQFKQVNWLMSRILAIEEKRAGNIESEAEFHYNPIRLSPKMTGEYPDNSLTPTCLAASIIVSSFFEKAGIPYLHAGVQMDRAGMQLLGATSTLSRVRRFLATEESGTSSPLIAESMLSNALKTNDEYRKDTGYHAGVYAKLSNGKWTQVDPFMTNQFDYLPASVSADIDELHATLKEFEADAPNLELSYGMHLLTFSIGMSEVVKIMLEDDQIGAGFDVALDALMNEPESVRQKIFEQYIRPHFERIEQMDINEYPAAHHTLNHIMTIPMTHIASGRQQDALEESFYSMFDKFVLWNDTLDNVRNRSFKDKEYFTNRMKDLINLPLVMCADLALNDLSNNYFDMKVHETVEFGLPYARIGFSVLSDFAAYCDDTLPPSFWAAHWPSLIPITETMNREENDDEQMNVLQNLANWERQRNLTYTKADSIIEKFLKTANHQEV